ncbi:hypothetical protein EHQ57_09985 [Leptospira wolffii]|uniref:hypothetical protein n=1 Tax=Leptospira wolffii TaxID=409998 RepID=UPI0010842C56|nr:hypothetical protein [Leptospira wolffii]TGK71462.1 hypothetical protein EHQ35_15170 [Leptospira wolffii]TGL29261.1 hypothetical protein EHQ57_09985 [Leptospira wolffii]
MKKILLISIFLFISKCSSQYGVIKEVKDDFKNSSTLTLEVYANSESTAKGAKTLFLNFTKSFDSNSAGVIRCAISAKTLVGGQQRFSSSIFLKIDSKKINIKLTANKIAATELLDLSIRSGEFTVTNELQNDILNANSLSVRFYSGEIAYDVDYSNSDLNVIKELIKKRPII